MKHSESLSDWSIFSTSLLGIRDAMEFLVVVMVGSGWLEVSEISQLGSQRQSMQELTRHHRHKRERTIHLEMIHDIAHQRRTGRIEHRLDAWG